MFRSKHQRTVLKKPLRLLLCILAAAYWIFGGPLQTAFLEENSDNFSDLDSYITSEMKKNGVPGLSLVIFDAQKTLYSKGFGVKSTKTKEAVDENTIFEAASFSKTLTAYAAMILVERGKLALDVPLNQYLKQPYLPDPKTANQITLRMILNHTSGLSNDSDGKDRKVYFKPGSYFSYSGAGFRYLQQVMEDVTDMPFARLMEEEIIKPLAMNSSSFVLNDELLSFMANGHEAGRAFPIMKKDANAAYSLLSTPTDMAKFIMEIYRPSLLKPETVKLMLEPMVKWQKNIYWGLGFGILRSSNEDFFWHWGNNYYFCSILIAGKESKQGVVIMTNGNTGMRLAGRLAIKIINTYFLKQRKGLQPETFDFLQ